MTDEKIFDLAETHGWQDDFGRWNFKDDGLIDFALALRKAEVEVCTKLLERAVAEGKSA
jgi:predicted transcriptional regulator